MMFFYAKEDLGRPQRRYPERFLCESSLECVRMGGQEGGSCRTLRVPYGNLEDRVILDVMVDIFIRSLSGRGS